MLHEAWSDGSFFPVGNESARALVDVGATRVWAVEADSWAEAMARYHEWRGWSPYRPMDGDAGLYPTGPGALPQPRHPADEFR